MPATLEYRHNTGKLESSRQPLPKMLEAPRACEAAGIVPARDTLMRRDGTGPSLVDMLTM